VGGAGGCVGVFAVPADTPIDGLAALLKKRMATRPEGRDSGIDDAFHSGSSVSKPNDPVLSICARFDVASSSLTKITGSTGLAVGSTGLLILLPVLLLVVFLYSFVYCFDEVAKWSCTRCWQGSRTSLQVSTAEQWTRETPEQQLRKNWPIGCRRQQSQQPNRSCPPEHANRTVT
jgi:hypothetical protein